MTPSCRDRFLGVKPLAKGRMARRENICDIFEFAAQKVCCVDEVKVGKIWIVASQSSVEVAPN